jgi:hypothetical protein
MSVNIIFFLVLGLFVSNVAANETDFLKKDIKKFYQKEHQLIEARYRRFLDKVNIKDVTPVHDLTNEKFYEEKFTPFQKKIHEYCTKNKSNKEIHSACKRLANGLKYKAKRWSDKSNVRSYINSISEIKIGPNGLKGKICFVSDINENVIEPKKVVERLKAKHIHPHDHKKKSGRNFHELTHVHYGRHIHEHKKSDLDRIFKGHFKELNSNSGVDNRTGRIDHEDLREDLLAICSKNEGVNSGPCKEMVRKCRTERRKVHKVACGGAKRTLESFYNNFLVTKSTNHLACEFMPIKKQNHKSALKNQGIIPFNHKKYHCPNNIYSVISQCESQFNKITKIMAPYVPGCDFDLTQNNEVLYKVRKFNQGELANLSLEVGSHIDLFENNKTRGIQTKKEITKTQPPPKQKRQVQKQREKERQKQIRPSQIQQEDKRKEQKRLTQTQRENERKEQERLARIQREKERKQQERLARVQRENKRKEQERLAQIQRKNEIEEKKRLAKVQRENERERLALIQRENERKEQERLTQVQREKEIEEQKRLAKVQQEKERKERERLAQIQREVEIKEQEREDQERRLLAKQREKKRKEREAYLNEEVCSFGFFGCKTRREIEEEAKEEERLARAAKQNELGGFNDFKEETKDKCADATFGFGWLCELDEASNISDSKDIDTGFGERKRKKRSGSLFGDPLERARKNVKPLGDF